jgi:beta-lactamase superfamily II metal-dependent hydrolase
MNELWNTQREKIRTLFSEYGKVMCVVTSLSVSVLALYSVTTVSSPSKLRVSFLDIGQGDAILIQTPSGKKMLVDGGPSDKVLTRIAEQTSYFTRDIDVMEETHPDADHVTGLIPVLEKYTVRMILETKGIGHTNVFDDLNKHIDNEHAEVHVAQTGDVIDFHDGVTANILYPPVNYVPKKSDTNDASVSIVVMYGSETFLLTGDLPSTEEGKLITAGVPKDITVYKAGHHGSKYSSGGQLLSYIRPEYSVISAGKDNRYGHPNPEAMARLQKYSKEILSTIDRGTISFVTDGRSMDVETQK